MSEQSLKEKTVKGVGWSAADNVLQYVVTFVVSIILARLLTHRNSNHFYRYM